MRLIIRYVLCFKTWVIIYQDSNTLWTNGIFSATSVAPAHHGSSCLDLSHHTVGDPGDHAKPYRTGCQTGEQGILFTNTQRHLQLMFMLKGISCPWDTRLCLEVIYHTASVCESSLNFTLWSPRYICHFGLVAVSAFGDWILYNRNRQLFGVCPICYSAFI